MAGNWHADSGGEVARDIAFKFVKQHEQFTVRRWEREAFCIQVNYRRAGSSERGHRGFEGVEDWLWCGHIGVESVQACSSDAKSRALEAVRIQELGIIGRNICGTSLARVLPSQRHAIGGGIAPVERAALNHSERRCTVGQRAAVGAHRILRMRNRHDTGTASKTYGRLNRGDTAGVTRTNDAAVGFTA